MIKVQHSPIARRSGRLATVLLVGASVIALAGCRGHNEGRMVGFQAPQPSIEERHPITVGKENTDIDFHVVAGQGLNDSQLAQLHNFVGLWRHEGVGQLMIGTSSAGHAAVAHIKDYLASVDVPPSAVRVLKGGAGQRSVKLSFLRYVATGPDCGKFATNLAENKKNENYGNFGCARQHNFAAMIANPRDLLMPRNMGTERDGERRDVVWEKWTNGDSTAAKVSEQENAAAISDVAK